MAQRLDTLDHKILTLLAQDGRLTCAQIARLIGNISERSVRYRLDHLLAEQYVRVRGLLNPSAFGYTVMSDVTVEAEPGQTMDLANAIAQFENVTYVACLASGTEIGVHVVARDNAEMFAFVNETLGKLPSVKTLSSSILPVVVKDMDSWRLPDSYFQS